MGIAWPFILVFLGDGITSHQLELTCLKNRKEKYNLGDHDCSPAFEVSDFEWAKKLHS